MIGAFSAARTFAQNYMPTYIAQGFSSRMIQRDLIARWGEAYRMQNIQADMRKFMGVMKKQLSLEKIPFNVAVPKNVIVETELLMPYKYRVHGQIMLFNEETGETYKKSVSFYDDWNRGKSEWIEEFTKQYAEGEYDEGIYIMSMKITQVEHDRRFPL
jgi:hypothetical protein